MANLNEETTLKCFLVVIKWVQLCYGGAVRIKIPPTGSAAHFKSRSGVKGADSASSGAVHNDLYFQINKNAQQRQSNKL